MTVNSPLPNFLIIGAAKCGTTTLFDALSQHPQVFCSTPKETHFFSQDETFALGMNWYLNTCFKDSAGYPARGEATPQYLSLSEKSVPRIQTTFGDAPLKFIAIFRDPVARAYSQYWQTIRYGEESLSFEDALAAEDKRLGKDPSDITLSVAGKFAYFRMGCYASRLKPFLDAFPRERFLFLLNEDLAKDFSRTMSRIASFIGVDTSYAFQYVKSNPSTLPTNQTMFNLLRKPSFVRRLARVLIPLPGLRGRIKDSVREAVIQPFQYPPMDQATEKQLRARYVDQVVQLEAMTGLKLSAWLPRQ